MKKINTTQVISPTSKQPFTVNSLAFLQNALDEDKAAMVKAIVYGNLGSYSLTIPYVISGCVLSDSNKDVTAGEIFYGGKFYQTTAVNGTTNIVQFILTKTYDATADPLIFSDGVSKNVHEIYKYVATDAATGGDFNATNLNYFLSAATLSRLSIITSTPQNISSSSFVDLTTMTLKTPNDGLVRNWLIIYKCWCDQDTTANDTYLEFRITNTLATTTYDTVKAGKAFSGIGGAVYLPVNMQSLIMTGLAPNTDIKVQAKAYIQSSTIYDQSLIMIQM